MTQYGYFPGCSLSSTAREYDLSARSVCQALGIELLELEEWNCCGASSAHALDRDIDLALSVRNISIAHRKGLDMVVPCAACYSRTANAWHVLHSDLQRRKALEKEFNFKFFEDLKVYHLLHVIDKASNHASAYTVTGKIVDLLSTVNPVCYYGCLINRPRGINPYDDMENPMMMDRILRRFGYKPIPWSFATECCGAALSLTRDDIVKELTERIIAAACDVGADAIVTACPLCQVNLESRQSSRFRILFFTELIGAAIGMSDIKDWLKMHLVNPKGKSGIGSNA